uniref:Replication protein A subunit n=1 Tax=Caenorhabditis japonica TaxID=281687 RepID=A0A8R1HT67_CAEJA
MEADEYFSTFDALQDQQKKEHALRRQLPLKTSENCGIMKIVWSQFDFMTGPELKFVWEVTPSTSISPVNLSGEDGSIADAESLMDSSGSNQSVSFEDIDDPLKSYYVSGGSVRQANKKFNNTGHDYELTLRSDSVVEAGGELLAAPKLNLKRVHLSEIAGHCGNLIDVLVVVERMDQDATEFQSRQGKSLVKREMELIDETQALVKLTLWGDEAKKALVDDYLHKVVAFKGVIPKEFNGGYSLSTGSGTRIVPVPEIAGVAELYDWYTTVKPSVELKSISLTSGGSGEPPRTIAGLQEMQFGKDSEKGDFASIKAMITRINPSTALYKGCPNEGCQKKLNDLDGEYRCEKCQSTTQRFKWLYMMQFELSDETGQVYVTAFGDNAAKVVGKPAQELGDLKDMDENEYQAIFDRIQFVPKMWRLRCKMESYNEEVRQKMTLFGVEDVNQDKYIENLKQLIEQMNGIQEEGGF